MFSFFKMNACSCDIPKPILEFQSAEYVFEGKVISKTYASDSLNYTVKFEIFKHYKKSDNPKFLEFTLKSEYEYTGIWTSCDWSVDNNEKWLVYAYYWKDKLTFGYNCSNSKRLTSRSTSKNEQQVLNNANEFEIDKYIFTELDGNFTNAKPKIDLDSILKKTDTIKKIRKLIEGKTIFVIGSGPSLSSAIPKLKKLEKSIKIAADSSLKPLVDNGIIPDIIVTDLDGDVKTLEKIGKTNSIFVVHAHGDNIEKLEFVKKFTPISIEVSSDLVKFLSTNSSILKITSCPLSSAIFSTSFPIFPYPKSTIFMYFLFKKYT